MTELPLDQKRFLFEKVMELHWMRPYSEGLYYGKNGYRNIKNFNPLTNTDQFIELLRCINKKGMTIKPPLDRIPNPIFNDILWVIDNAYDVIQLILESYGYEQQISKLQRENEG